MKRNNSFHIYASITILFWSLPYVLTKLSSPYFTPFSLAFVCFAVASLTLVPFALIAKVRPPRLRDVPWFFASGGMGFFLYMIVFNTGNPQVTAATGSIVLTSVPVLTAVLARIFYKERLKTYQWIAVGVEFVGIVVLLLIGDSFSFNMGVLWLTLGSFLLSSYNLLQRRLSRTYTPLQTAVYSIFAGTLLLCMFAPSAVGQFRQAPAIVHVYIVVMGVLSSAMAYVAWTVALSRAEKTSYASNYMFITPFLTTIWGVVLGHEVPGWSTVLGGLIILSGVLLFYRENFRRSAAKTAPAEDEAEANA